MKKTLLVLIVLITTSVYASPHRFERQPLLVMVGGTSVLTRTLGSDRKIRFEVCTTAKDDVKSDAILFAHVNSDAATCDVLSRGAVDADDPRALAAFASKYRSALEKEFGNRARFSPMPLINYAMLMSAAGIGGVALISDSLRASALAIVSVAGAAAILTGFFLILRLELRDIRLIKQRPPNERESDIVRLSGATEVTNPANFAPRAIFNFIGWALATSDGYGPTHNQN